MMQRRERTVNMMMDISRAERRQKDMADKKTKEENN